MTWTIHPYEGMGPLRFGMSRTEVAAILGSAVSAKTTFTGSLTERRGEADPICTYVSDRLAEIEVGPATSGLRIGETDVFGDDPFQVLLALYKTNGGALAGLGSVLFLGLGINTTGFIDLKTLRYRAEPDERSLTLFQKGQFDSLLDDYAPWTIRG